MAESERAPLFAEGAGSTLALVGYIAIAVVLMVADRRGGYLQHVRAGLLQFLAPLYQVAQWPSRLGNALTWQLADRGSLQARNRELYRTLMQLQAELAELRARDAEATRVRALVDFAARRELETKVARLIDIDLDPFSHRIALDKGRADGVAEGSTLFDGHGIVGQVIELGSRACVAMLISDPNHGIPIEAERSGLRAVAVGQGRADLLLIDDLPVNADLQVGDAVRTSGLGGRFPVGFAVGTVTALERDPGAAFMRALVQPAARLGQARELMLLPPVEFEGPPLAPAPP
jgi:rod shape-determining protein MreC